MKKFRETGSFRHGTGVHGHVDVDLLVSLGGSKPQSSDTALNWVKTALQASFPRTTIHTSRPAVVAEFGDGSERWEVVPAFLTARGGPSVYIYDIPGVPSGWIDTAPEEHLTYVNEVNSLTKVKGGAKGLARFAKAWKYYNNVPISSFYLEMRAASYIANESSLIWSQDVCRYFEHLESISLASMNDPRGATGRIYPCSTTAKTDEALSKVRSAAKRARKAVSNETSNPADAFYNWDLVFNYHFPSRL